MTPSLPKLLLCGQGYLGHAIAREFREAGWQIAATSLSGGDDTLACDLGNAESVGQLATQIDRPDFIIHCASSGRGGPEAYRSVYLDGCHHLTEIFPSIPLLFTSSSSVYAQTDGSKVTEDSPAEPERETGKLLRETEEHVLSHGGLVARLAGIYGPHRSVILRKFLEGAAIIEEDGQRYLNQIHRDDAARAILHLATLPAGAYRLFNVADSQPLTQFECYQGLANLFNRPLPPSGPRDLNRKRGWTHKQVSSARLQSTGWTPHFPSFLDAAAIIAGTLDES